jgi:hypothetical protein
MIIKVLGEIFTTTFFKNTFWCIRKCKKKKILWRHQSLKFCQKMPYSIKKEPEKSILNQRLKNVTERNGINGIFSETERNETENIWETKRNETKFKETKLKRQNNSVSEKK